MCRLPSRASPRRGHSGAAGIPKSRSESGFFSFKACHDSMMSGESPFNRDSVTVEVPGPGRVKLKLFKARAGVPAVPQANPPSPWPRPGPAARRRAGHQRAGIASDSPGDCLVAHWQAPSQLPGQLARARGLPPRPLRRPPVRESLVLTVVRLVARSGLSLSLDPTPSHWQPGLLINEAGGDTHSDRDLPSQSR
jgi:hypothetical protein